MKPRSTHYDAVIVGGGHNGLVAGFYLAAAGRRVLIVEQRAQAGGLCAPVEFFPGYRGTITNTPSALEPRIFEDMQLEHFGVTFDRPDPTMVFPLADGRSFKGWRDRKRTEADLHALAPKDVEAYFGVIEFFNDFARKLGVSVFDDPPSLAELAASMRTPDDEAAFAEVFFGSIQDFLDRRLSSPHLKALLASLSMSAGNVAPSTPGSPIGLLRRPLSLVSGNTTADDPRRHMVRGSTGLPRGGMGTIAEAMRAAAEARGVEICLETRVERILTAGERATGVVLSSGDEVTAQTVLSNINPKTTLLSLLDNAALIPTGLADRLRDLRMAGGAFKLVLALDGMPIHRSATSDEEARQLAACQYRYSPTVEYLEEAYDDYKYGHPSRRPKLLGLTPSVVDPSLAPPGRHLMSVNVWYAPYRLASGTWDEETKDKFAANCIDTIEEFIPNIKDIIVDQRTFSPVDFEREYGLVEGHQLHGDMTPLGMFGNRPTPGLARYRTPVQGLYLCGSGVWPGGTVTGIPGYNAAARVLRDTSGTQDEVSTPDVPSAG
ncbi:phytoene desaturase family protein [Dactylosporangium sp. CA-139114]|uniref:phytoene desaturase family protein n=1 Tax=Dactylosporangium sp. CA-139114 TaxID=3239931 RepID=UPI003D9602FD